MSFAIEVVLKFRKNPAPVQNRDSTRVAKPRGPLGRGSCATDTREAAEKHLDTGEAPGRKGPFGQPGEAPGKDHLDSLRGTREVPGRQERTILDSLRGTREVPGRQERILWTA